MRTLVIYYSKTGTTRSVAERIARATGGDLEEIIEAGKRGGNLRSAFDATLSRRPAVKPFTRSLDGYDLVFVGTPIWKMTAVPAMHVFLPSQDWTNQSVALFCTTAVVGTQRGLAAMKEPMPGACVVGELALDGAALKDEDAVDSRASSCERVPRAQHQENARVYGAFSSAQGFAQILAQGPDRADANSVRVIGAVSKCDGIP